MEKVNDICDALLKALNGLMGLIEEENLQNEQFVLDFCDELNKLSVRY